MNPKVSVVVITYNHERFIKQTLDGILMQETDFDFDILIGEDDSSDDTRNIVVAYQKEHLDKIRLFLHDRKDVIYINGRPTGRWNLIDTLQHATGEYIAYTEGDDYWTDPHKLQKQADLLDGHPEYAMCFHNVTKIYDDDSNPPHLFPDPPVKEEYALKDLIMGIGTPSTSLMYRNRLFDQFPEWYYYDIQQGDWPLHVLNAQYGNIGFIDEAMGVYRVHSGGVFSTKSDLQKLYWEVEKFRILNQHLDFQYGKIFASETHWRRSKIANMEGRRMEAYGHLIRHMAASPATAFSRPRRMLVHSVKILFPKAAIWKKEFLKRFQNAPQRR